MFNKYPYTDFHEINLDWILAEIKRLHHDYDDFKAVNTITNAGAWDITKQYSPWTIVSDNNAGYISLKPVPVGVDITNANYWGLIADYDILITNLSDRISALEERFDLMDNKTYIFMTDSYGNYTNANGRNFIAEACYQLGITNFYDFHLGSAGFSRTGTLNFLDILQNNEGIIPDKTVITDIIVCSGANDQITANMSLIEPGILAFVNYVKTEYPNANVQIGHFTNTIEPLYSANIFNSILSYQNSSKYGASYIENSEYVMMKLSFFNTDNVHPSADGIEALSRYLRTYLHDGHFDVNEMASSTLSDGTNAVVANDHLTQYQHNGSISLKVNGGALVKVTLNTTTSSGYGETTIDDICEETDGFIIGYTGLNTTLNVILSASMFSAPAILYFRKIEGSKRMRIGVSVYNVMGAQNLTTFTLLSGADTLQAY